MRRTFFIMVAVVLLSTGGTKAIPSKMLFGQLGQEEIANGPRAHLAQQQPPEERLPQRPQEERQSGKKEAQQPPEAPLPRSPDPPQTNPPRQGQPPEERP